MTLNPAAPLDKRGQFIAARKADLFRALGDELGFATAPGSEAEHLCRMLTAILHHEALPQRERLHAAYHHLDPSQHRPPAPAETTRAAYAELAAVMESVLHAAAFIEVEPAEMERAAREIGRIKYPVRMATADFSAIRLFHRGRHRETIEHRWWWGLRKRSIEIEVFDEVVLFAALKPVIGPRRRRGRKRRIVPGSVMVKCFHDIASADLDALYPDVRVVLTRADTLMLGLPALLAGIPLLIKLAPAFFVLYGLLRFYFGDAPPGQDGIGEALIVASGVVALGGFLMNQWVKYERRALRYQQDVNDAIYFHNVTNNVGVFDHIIGVAEEQDCKEALLAYLFLLRAPATEAVLDRKIETWLLGCFGAPVDFDAADALRRIERLGLLRRDGDRLSVLPLPDALRALERRWDGFFASTPAQEPLQASEAAIRASAAAP